MTIIAIRERTKMSKEQTKKINEFSLLFSSYQRMRQLQCNNQFSSTVLSVQVFNIGIFFGFSVSEANIGLHRYLRVEGLAGNSLLSDFRASILEDRAFSSALMARLFRWECCCWCPAFCILCNCDDCCDGVELVLSVAKSWEKMEKKIEIVLIFHFSDYDSTSSFQIFDVVVVEWMIS